MTDAPNTANTIAAVTPNPVTNAADAVEESMLDGDHWGGHWKVLTPTMRERGGKLSLILNRLPPGRAGCPFHAHQREDEVFYVLSGKGRLRYGDLVQDIGPGDCVECPAGTGIAHQIANPFDEELVYLAMGPHDPDEVATYPDSGKVLVRSLGQVGVMRKTPYMEGEPEVPAILSMKPTS